MIRLRPRFFQDSFTREMAELARHRLPMGSDLARDVGMGSVPGKY